MSRNIRIAVFLLVFGLVYVPFVRNYGTRLIPENSDDFPSYYFGADLAFNSRVSPYDPSNWRTVPIQYAGDNARFYPYLYPPPSLFLFWPFTGVDYPSARIGMLVLNHILILVISALILNRILALEVGEPLLLLYIACTFSFFPLYQTMDKGQTNLIVLLLLVLSWVALKEDKGSFAIGAPLAFAIILKLTPALLLVPIWLRRRRDAVLWTLVLLVVLIAFSLVLLPPGTWASWFVHVGSKGYAQAIGDLNLSTPANQSLNALVNRAFYGRNVRFDPIIDSAPLWVKTFAIYLLSGMVLILSFIASWLLQKGNDKYSIDLEFSLWIVASFLVAPISWDHHLVFLLPVFFVLLLGFMQTRTHIPELIVLGATAVFLSLPYPSNAPQFREGLKTLLISMQLFAVCVLWLLNLVAILHRRRCLVS